MIKTLTRRNILAGLAAAATAASTNHASAAVGPQESPDLLKLAYVLPDLAKAYNDAAAHVQTIADTWGPQWPTPDPEIFWFGGNSKRHTDILGRGVETPWGKGDIKRVHNIGTPEGFESEFHTHTKKAEHKSKLKSQRGMKSELQWAERSKAKIKPARAFWSEVDRIKKASGIEDALAEQGRALDALRDTVGEILTFEEISAIGLAVKAQALVAWGDVPNVYQLLNPQAPAWMAGVAATLTRQVQA